MMEREWENSRKVQLAPVLLLLMDVSGAEVVVTVVKNVGIRSG